MSAAAAPHLSARGARLWRTGKPPLRGFGWPKGSRLIAAMAPAVACRRKGYRRGLTISMVLLKVHELLGSEIFRHRQINRLGTRSKK